MARPGIMLYFDILEPIRVLPDADKGRLLVAMLEYGQSGVVPELDGSLKIVWSFVRPMIDKDGERYEDMKLQREYAAFCKKRKRIWMPKILFDEWVCMTEDERQRAVDPVASRNPISATTNNGQLHPSVSNNNGQLHPSVSNDNVQLQQSVSNDNSHQQEGGFAAATDRNVDVFGGALGKNVVFLSQAQIEDLLDQMGIETFDYYVDKLSNYIIHNNAHVKNHYETILKWWQEDGSVRTRPGRKKEVPKGASGVLGPEEMENIRRLLQEGQGEQNGDK